MSRPIAYPASKPADNTSSKGLINNPRSPRPCVEKNRRTIVLGPPAKVAPTDDIVEDKADEHPGHKVERRRRRQATRAGEDDWESDVFEEIDLELLVQDPLNQRQNEPGQEEEDEAVVQLAVREQTLWPNHTPLRHD